MGGRERTCVAITRRIGGGLRWLYILLSEVNERRSSPLLSFCGLAIEVFCVTLTLGVSFCRFAVVVYLYVGAKKEHTTSSVRNARFSLDRPAMEGIKVP